MFIELMNLCDITYYVKARLLTAVRPPSFNWWQPEHVPVDVDATAANAFVMSGFIHRLCVMRMPSGPEAIQHEQEATAAFRSAQRLRVANLQEVIATMESQIQRCKSATRMHRYWS